MPKQNNWNLHVSNVFEKNLLAGSFRDGSLVPTSKYTLYVRQYSNICSIALPMAYGESGFYEI